jgi:hypothetical protein
MLEYCYISNAPGHRCLMPNAQQQRQRSSTSATLFVLPNYLPDRNKVPGPRPLQLVLDAGDAHQLRLEDEHAVGRDGAHGAGAVRPVGLDGELALLARAHVQQALVPALDDLALADGEGEGLPAVVGGVEFGAWVGEG